MWAPEDTLPQFGVATLGIVNDLKSLEFDNQVRQVLSALALQEQLIVNVAEPLGSAAALELSSWDGDHHDPGDNRHRRTRTPKLKG